MRFGDAIHRQYRKLVWLIAANMLAMIETSCHWPAKRFRSFNMRTTLIVILILLLIGAFPAWPYSSGWGYYPVGGIGLLLLVIIILAFTGRI